MLRVLFPMGFFLQHSQGILGALGLGQVLGSFRMYHIVVKTVWDQVLPLCTESFAPLTMTTTPSQALKTRKVAKYQAFHYFSKNSTLLLSKTGCKTESHHNRLYCSSIAARETSPQPTHTIHSLVDLMGRLDDRSLLLVRRLVIRLQELRLIHHLDQLLEGEASASWADTLVLSRGHQHTTSSWIETALKQPS